VKLRRLGRTQLEISEIGFGCGPTAGLMIHGSEQERRLTVARALDLGINYFDTAPGYGNSLSEKNLGETLRALDARPIVATKVALSVDELQNIPDAVARSVEASLARLGLPRIVLIQLHNRVGPRRRRHHGHHHVASAHHADHWHLTAAHHHSLLACPSG